LDSNCSGIWLLHQVTIKAILCVRNDRLIGALLGWRIGSLKEVLLEVLLPKGAGGTVVLLDRTDQIVPTHFAEVVPVLRNRLLHGLNRVEARNLQDLAGCETERGRRVRRAWRRRQN